MDVISRQYSPIRAYGDWPFLFPLADAVQERVLSCPGWISRRCLVHQRRRGSLALTSP